MSNIMIDLETMGTGSNAAIIAIGAVGFDKHQVQDESTGFYAVVDLQSAVEHGGVIDTSTVLWWMQQSEQARGAICKRDAASIPAVLRDFHDWVLMNTPDKNDVKVWGNGSDFDNVILRNAYLNAGLGNYVPWRYNNSRCYRTMKNIYPHVPIVDHGVKHHALHDAIAQAAHMVAIWQAQATPAGA